MTTSNKTTNQNNQRNIEENVWFSLKRCCVVFIFVLKYKNQKPLRFLLFRGLWLKKASYNPKKYNLLFFDNLL